MKTYNFDEVVDRRGTCSYKWDLAPEGVIPMWVADMDFKVAEPIQQALITRVQHGIFGYTAVPDTYYDAVINWFRRRHGWTMKRDWMIYTSGVVPAISAIIKAMTTPGDKVLVQCPVYNCFFSSIRNNGCQMLSNDLVYANNTYTIDFDDFEQKASDPLCKVFLLCNPHNPAGRVWTAEELRRMGEICLKHNVFVIADEIHCELVMPGYQFTPFASLGEDFLMSCAVCTSPTKNFNIAGLQISNITAADEQIRQRIDKAININEVCDVNPLGVVALQAAYNESEDWLEQLLAYLYQNYLCLCDFMAENMPDMPVVKLEGTYLAWVDCSALNMPSQEIEDKLMEKGLWLNAGIHYGAPGDRFIRINLACPRSVLQEGLNRLLKIKEH